MKRHYFFKPHKLNKQKIKVSLYYHSIQRIELTATTDSLNCFNSSMIFYKNNNYEKQIYFL